jgi:hypothetical protein
MLHLLTPSQRACILLQLELRTYLSRYIALGGRATARCFVDRFSILQGKQMAGAPASSLI